MSGGRATLLILSAVCLTLTCLAMLLAPNADAGPADGGLRLNQLQIVGTGESYKQAPASGLLTLVRLSGKKNAQKLDFGEPPLAAQLDQGARALSFDIAYDPKGGLFKTPAAAAMADDLLDKDFTEAMAAPGFKVVHVLDVDYRSSCLTLRTCLGQVVAWSQAHPGHLPIMISLTSNSEKTPMPGAATPQAWDGAALAALEREITAAIPPDMLLTPRDVKGSSPSLRQAVLEHGWPLLASARGEVIVLLNDTPAKVALYDGQTMFVTAPESAPNAAFIAIADPRTDGARITAAVKAGFMVVTTRR